MIVILLLLRYLFTNQFEYIGLLFLISSVNGDLTLFPIDKEVIYSWHAELETGTAFPKSLSSKWNFNASLIVQHTPDDNITTFKVSMPFFFFNVLLLLLLL